MIRVLVIIIILFGCVKAINVIADENPEYPEIVEDDAETKALFIRNSRRRFYSSTKYVLLYRQSFIDKPQMFKSGDEKTKTQVLKDHFDPSVDTKIILHGFWANSDDDIGQLTKNAYLDYGDYNVFLIDWSSLAETFNYKSAVNATRITGIFCALLIEDLVKKFQANIKTIHIIGHSLGAHTAGFAGHYTKEYGLGTVARITGLDPAGPRFTNAHPDDRLDPSDADFVDVIHTDADVFGINKEIGTADFWPNGGSDQPGCNTPICDHKRAHQMFAVSISRKFLAFVAFPCKDYATFKKGKCRENASYMGDDVLLTSKGSYYLDTAKKYPYSKKLPWDESKAE